MKILIEQFAMVGEKANEVVVYFSYSNGVGIPGKSEFRFSLSGITDNASFRAALVVACLDFANIKNNFKMAESDILGL